MTRIVTQYSVADDMKHFFIIACVRASSVRALFSTTFDSQFFVFTCHDVRQAFKLAWRRQYEPWLLVSERRIFPKAIPFSKTKFLIDWTISSLNAWLSPLYLAIQFIWPKMLIELTGICSWPGAPILILEQHFWSKKIYLLLFACQNAWQSFKMAWTRKRMNHSCKIQE